MRARPETTPASGRVANAALRPESPSAMVPVSGTALRNDGTLAPAVRIFLSMLDLGVQGRGRIYAETRADAHGRFHLDLPALENPWARLPGTGTLWAYQPGSLVAAVPVYRGAIPPGLPMQLVVGPPARARFQVFLPDGKPVKGAKIQPCVLDHFMSLVPDSLAGIIGAETITNAHGLAVMTAFYPDQVASIRVLADGFGQQEFRFGFEEIKPETKVVRLQPIGRLRGRLVGDKDAVRRRLLSLIGFSRPEDLVQSSISLDVTTDDEGRFDIPEIAAGHHGIRTVPRFDLPSYGRSEGLVNVEPGKTYEVVIPLKRAVLVRGVVRERGTEKPIEGVRLAVALEETGAMTTDRDGRYQGYVPPGGTFMVPRAVPLGYAMPIYGPPRQVTVPEEAVDFVLPAMELQRAGVVRGSARDEHARPVSGALVDASWTFNEGREGTGPHDVTVRSGPDGGFVIEGVPEGARIALSAHRHGLRTTEPAFAQVGSDARVTILRLTRSRSVALGGRVLDALGRPVAGAAVHLRSQQRIAPKGSVIGDELVEFESGSVVLLTDAEGRYRTPKELDPDGEYAAYVSAPGLESSRTRWRMGHEGSLPDLTLRAEAESPK